MFTLLKLANDDDEEYDYSTSCLEYRDRITLLGPRGVVFFMRPQIFMLI